MNNLKKCDFCGEFYSDSDLRQLRNLYVCSKCDLKNPNDPNISTKEFEELIGIERKPLGLEMILFRLGLTIENVDD